MSHQGWSGAPSPTVPAISSNEEIALAVLRQLVALVGQATRPPDNRQLYITKGGGERIYRQPSTDRKTVECFKCGGNHFISDCDRRPTQAPVSASRSPPTSPARLPYSVVAAAPRSPDRSASTCAVTALEARVRALEEQNMIREQKVRAQNEEIARLRELIDTITSRQNTQVAPGIAPVEHAAQQVNRLAVVSGTQPTAIQPPALSSESSQQTQPATASPISSRTKTSNKNAKKKAKKAQKQQEQQQARQHAAAVDISESKLAPSAIAATAAATAAPQGDMRSTSSDNIAPSPAIGLATAPTPASAPAQAQATDQKERESKLAPSAIAATAAATAAPQGDMRSTSSDNIAPSPAIGLATASTPASAPTEKKKEIARRSAVLVTDQDRQMRARMDRFFSFRDQLIQARGHPAKLAELSVRRQEFEAELNWMRGLSPRVDAFYKRVGHYGTKPNACRLGCSVCIDKTFIGINQVTERFEWPVQQERESKLASSAIAATAAATAAPQGDMRSTSSDNIAPSPAIGLATASASAADRKSAKKAVTSMAQLSQHYRATASPEVKHEAKLFRIQRDKLLEARDEPSAWAALEEERKQFSVQLSKHREREISNHPINKQNGHYSKCELGCGKCIPRLVVATVNGEQYVYE